MQREQSLGLRAEDGREGRRRQPRAVAFAIQISTECDEVLRDQMPVDAILESGAFTHEERATAEQLPARAGLEIRNPDRGKEINAEELGQLARIITSGARQCRVNKTRT